jgi:predicted nucleic acid-binding protein
MGPTRSSRKPALSETWIVNASPLISLAKAGYLDLLSKLAPHVIVPDAVASEVLAGLPSDPARKALENGWGDRASPRQIPSNVLEWGLGAGESAVLALCLEKSGCKAVLDDAAARSCARALELPLLGTLAVVLRARHAGLIPSASQVMAALREAGLRLDDKTIRSALERVGEIWPPAVKGETLH